MTGNGKFAAFNQVIRNPTISPAAKGLYALLWSYADGDCICWPGIERLAQEMGCDERTIRRLAEKLVKAGAITKKRRGRTLTNVYFLGDGTVLSSQEGSDRTEMSGHTKSDRTNLSRVTGQFCPSDRTNLSTKNAPPAYGDKASGERNIPINIPINNTTNVGSEQVASAKGKVPPSRCGGVVVNPTGGSAKVTPSNERLRKNEGDKCSGPGQPATGSTSRKRNKEGDSRIPAMFEYFRQTFPTVVIDYGKHGRLLKTRFAALDSQHQPEESLTLMKRLWDTYLQLEDDWQVKQDGHTLDGFLQSRTFSKVWSLARKQAGTGAKVTGGLSRILRG